MKIATVVGARPQFVKAAAFHRSVEERNASGSGAVIEHFFIHTGQHYDRNMSDIFFQEMDIPDPKYHLGIGGETHGAMTGRMLENIEQILMDEQPDWVVVLGDTNSTLAGALAAVKLHISIAHIEAGLRSFNRKMPEEINRVLTDHCSDLLFAPTAHAVSQLLKEGVVKDKICQSGDLMYDTALYWKNALSEENALLAGMGLNSGGYVLCTLHRAENTDVPDRLKEIVEGLILISGEIPVLLPLHPRTSKALKEHGLYEKIRENMRIVEPLGYLDMIDCVRRSLMVLTDSGGLQKEAYFFQIPCVTLRSETEWVELLDHGFNMLSPLKGEAILDCYRTMRNKSFDWDIKLYGDGHAGRYMVQRLLTG